MVIDVLLKFKEQKEQPLDYYPKPKPIPPIGIQGYRVDSHPSDFDPHNIYWHWAMAWKNAIK